MATSSRASLDSTTSTGSRGRSRAPRGPGFSGEEVKFLFKTVETLLPGSTDEWDALARVYNARFPLATRSGESLRRKFLKLGRADYAERSRRIKVLIQKRLRKEAGFELPEDQEGNEEGEEERDDGYQPNEQPREGVSGTDSDAHGSQNEARTEHEREETVETVETVEGPPTGRRSSSISSDEPGDVDDASDVSQDRVRAPDASSAAVEPVVSGASMVVESVASSEAPVVQRGVGASQPPSPPPLVYKPLVASTPKARPQSMATHPAPPSDQQPPHSPPDRSPLFPLPAPVVTVGQHQRDDSRESTTAPSTELATLSSPTVVNRWFALEERRLQLDEQRMAFEQRRLDVEERRVQLLERRMDADAAERNRLLEALQLVVKSSGASSRLAES